ncbi:Hypothetical protein NTJ_05671 [Nesidiocoris tenuis]|nr:Hypothetical protein NTJ_05671 [Nesidiocoris tenuis]
MFLPELPLGTELETPASPAFYFDSSLLRTVIDEVVETCSFLPQFMTDEINRRIENLPQEDARRIATSIDKFFEKFVTPSTQGRKFYVADILPVDNITITDFRSQLCASLRNGSTNKYFVGTMMLKLAVDHDWRDLATDVLYEFVLNRPCRQVVDDMLDHCRFIFPESVRSSTKLIICNVAISCCLRSYESGDMGESAAIFNVLRQHNTSLHDLEPYLYSVPRSTQALVCCNLYIFESLFSEAVDMFLQNVLVPYIEEIECSPSLGQINKTIDELVSTLSKSNSIDPILKLFGAIFSIVKEHGSTLGEQLNIRQLSEIVLRCCFIHHSRENVRESCLKLYFDLSANYAQLDFKKVTQRSLLLAAVNQIDKTCRAAMQLIPNLLSSPMKKLLVHAIRAGAYPKLSTSCDRFELHSTMTFDEIRIYLIWWMFKYLEARKRMGVKYYQDTTVTVIQDCVMDNSRYPVHYSLHNVDNSITGCATRLTAVLKKLVPFPIHSSLMLQKKKLGVYQIPWYTVSALLRPVIQCINLYDFTNVKNSYLCSSCFDKDDIVVKFNPR